MPSLDALLLGPPLPGVPGRLLGAGLDDEIEVGGGGLPFVIDDLAVERGRCAAREGGVRDVLALAARKGRSGFEMRGAAVRLKAGWVTSVLRLLGGNASPMVGVVRPAPGGPPREATRERPGLAPRRLVQSWWRSAIRRTQWPCASSKRLR